MKLRKIYPYLKFFKFEMEKGSGKWFVRAVDFILKDEDVGEEYLYKRITFNDPVPEKEAPDIGIKHFFHVFEEEK